jgi:hypothetical protein
MTNKASRSNKTLLRREIEQALVNGLLRSDAVDVRWNRDAEIQESDIEVFEIPNSKIEYPWNPADPNAEAFFNELEQHPVFGELSDADFADRSESFFSHLDSLFAAPTLQSALSQKFAMVPQALLNAIANHAQNMVNSSATLADQLVQCVQEALPQWAEDDLLVLARPLAYAMRGDETNAVDATVNGVRSKDWEKMSETEQAKLTLAIARYALGQLDNQG